MAVQGAIKLSVLIAFRDREPLRAERCLASLAGQKFQDFEVVVLDYGSAPEISAELKRIAERFSRTRYFYNHTRGMPWNRAHALNSAARFAAGEYLLCTDVDLIFSPDVLSRLAEAAAPDALVGGGFFLLPEGFGDWAGAASGAAAGLPAGSPHSLGAIQLLPREAFQRIGGFDEFFRIWGVEDLDLRNRLERAGIRSRRIELPPVYHQWHRGSAVPDMPTGWLEAMNLRALGRRRPDGNGAAAWGRCLGPADRPSLSAGGNAANSAVISLPAGIEAGFDPKSIAAWEKIVFLRRLLRELTEGAPGAVVVCEIRDTASIRLRSWFARLVRRRRFRVLAGRRFFDYRREGRDILWYVIVFSGLVADYCIEERPGLARYVLVKGSD